MATTQPNTSGIRDNHGRGRVADFPRQQLKAGADLDLVTAGFQRKLADGLQSGRRFVLPNLAEQVSPDSEFELVTWLVVLEAAQPP